MVSSVMSSAGIKEKTKFLEVLSVKLGVKVDIDNAHCTLTTSSHLKQRQISDKLLSVW